MDLLRVLAGLERGRGVDAVAVRADVARGERGVRQRHAREREEEDDDDEGHDADEADAQARGRAQREVGTLRVLAQAENAAADNERKGQADATKYGEHDRETVVSREQRSKQRESSIEKQ